MSSVPTRPTARTALRDTRDTDAAPTRRVEMPGYPARVLASVVDTAEMRRADALSQATVEAPCKAPARMPDEPVTQLRSPTEALGRRTEGRRLSRATPRRASAFLIVTALGLAAMSRIPGSDAHPPLATKTQPSRASAAQPEPEPEPGSEHGAPQASRASGPGFDPARLTPARAAEHLASGRCARAMAAYRGLATKHPDEPVYAFIANHLERRHTPSCRQAR